MKQNLMVLETECHLGTPAPPDLPSCVLELRVCVTVTGSEPY